ncbi:MAG: hypothetical protein J5950_06805 [Clostridia bacterium]|nr:hypothetical protein [Clostridia bacterium]
MVKKAVCILAAFVMIVGLASSLKFEVRAEGATNLHWEGNVAVWDPYEGATGYRLILYWRTWQPVFDEKVTECRFDFSEYLHPGYYYQFAVIWEKGSETGEPVSSPSIEVPGDPENINVRIQPLCNMVYWDELEGTDYYDLWVCDENGVQLDTLIHQIPGDSCEYSIADYVYRNGNRKYKVLISAYRDGAGNEFARGESEPADLSISEADYPSIVNETCNIEYAEGDSPSPGIVNIKTGGKALPLANKYVKFEVEGADAGYFEPYAFGNENYASVNEQYTRYLSVVNDPPAGEYHATLRLMYNPEGNGSSGSHWMVADTCEIILNVTAQSEEEQIPEARVTLTVPEAGSHPDPEPKVETDEAYTVNSAYWYERVSPYNKVEADGVFEPGMSYAVRIVFKAKDGYIFAPDAKFYLNGEESTSMYLGDYDKAQSMVGYEWTFVIPEEATEAPTEAPTDIPADVPSDVPATEVPTDAPDEVTAAAPTDVNTTDQSGVNTGAPDDNEPAATATPGGNGGEQKNEKAKKSGIGLGILIGVLITLAILGAALGVFFIIKRRKK